ncbi:MAG: acyl-CoA dehydrogenase family protein [Bacteroidia bacterium]|nr:acyl-CoA dehydrogenase family protein [Bacteroidia bacterium]MCX7651921.1 acyl-CoA dehydrogenase family protein [Bacteroidia bacterium]MDW8416072.1 acyl-CoA dehydrogenase family protein [Bacteroidia bacterium]
MAQAIAQQHITRGGAFLIKSTPAEAIFIPEEWNEEQRQLAQLCEEFLEKEIYPRLDEIDYGDPTKVMPEILRKAAELGFLGLTVPEEYGGLGADFLTGMLFTEKMGPSHSFAVALLAHTGIGTLPILYFGTPDQKRKYLPKIVSGELFAAYCLTEPGSGSDALSARTKAIPSSDGKTYYLTGQKMWITNGGFADLFTVFAKVNGEQFSAFLVERSFPGVSVGAEEKKMGIKGSSTRQVFFQDTPVPADNFLGELGKGHVIAFNILNIGRIKLAAATTGSSKRLVDISVKYAKERHQFGKPIASFTAIQHKLADMAIYTWACETATYRASADIQAYEKFLLEKGEPYEKALLGAAQEYAAECAILKVFGSEVLDYVADEAVQIHGGYGYSAEYPVERAYRDSRINRIYEGTNEINRMLSVDYILRKAMKGELDLLSAAMKVQGELMSIPEFGEPNGAFLAAEKKAVENLKKAILMVAGYAAQKYMQKLADEQEILMAIADMLIDTYVTESMLLRTEKIALTQGEAAATDQLAMTQVFLTDAQERAASAGRRAILHAAQGDERRMLLMGLKRFTKPLEIDTIALRRQIAERLIAAEKYCF